MYELIIYRIADGKEKFMNKTEKNFYELFGIDKNASDEVIKKAYRSLISKYHPDIYQGDKVYAEEMTKKINYAYSILKDNEKRKIYDILINRENYINKETVYEDNIKSNNTSKEHAKENTDENETKNKTQSNNTNQQQKEDKTNLNEDIEEITNKFALCSFAFGIFSFLFPLASTFLGFIAIILGIIAISTYKSSLEKNMWMAMAGISIGLFWFFLMLGFLGS